MVVRLASLAALLVCAPILSVQAQERSQLEVCARLANDAERLACFDRLVPRPVAPADSAAQLEQANRVLVPSQPLTSSPLGDRWAIGLTSGETLFDVRPHKPTYILPARYTDRVNQRPTSPTQTLPGDVGDILDATEAKFQISFKFKLADMTDTIGASLWAGYTQQSQWQVYNAEISRPFRETNYEPELMLAWHPDKSWGGWRWRLFNVGLVHQSNGRADPLSRSWNRVYAQFGVERGDFMVLVRPWYRIRENAADDNNPDITNYLGRGDLTLAWRTGNHVLSSTARLNLSSGNGSIQGTWGFPLFRRVNGYLQVFSGYGESMIDYNHYQNTIGIGFSIADWM
jgi:phospholipase A1